MYFTSSKTVKLRFDQKNFMRKYDVRILFYVCFSSCCKGLMIDVDLYLFAYEKGVN